MRSFLSFGKKGVLLHDSMRMRKSDVKVVFLCSIYKEAVTIYLAIDL